MAEESHEKLQLNLEILMEIVCDDFPYDACTAVRALLMCAADANAVRDHQAAASGISPSELGLGIRVDVNLETRTVRIRMDGPGLSREEIEKTVQDLGTATSSRMVGRRGARETELIHRAVRSFMQAILWSTVASGEIIIDSLAVGDESRPWRLRYAGGNTLETGPGERSSVGTTIQLHLKREYAQLCDPQQLPQLLREYGQYLQFPILWRDRQVNTMSPPWHQEGSTPEDHAAFLRSRFPDRRPPLLVVPLKIEEASLDIRGVLWIPGEDLRLFDDILGVADLYHRRLLVEKNHSHLLPSWARFFRGIVDVVDTDPDSRPGPGRMDISHFRQRLETFLLEYLASMLLEAPGQFNHVAERHDQLVKLAAIENDGFFDIAVDHLAFTTNRGPRTIPQYLAEVQQHSGEAVLHYQSVPFEASFSTVRHAETPIIDASTGLDEAVLRKYDRLNPAVRLIKIDAPGRPVVEEVADERYQPVVDLFAGLDPPVTARPARFEPTSLPGILTGVENDEMRPQLQQLFMLSQVSGAIPAEARDALQRTLSVGGGASPQTILHFNIDCPVIRSLLETIKAGETQRAREVAEIIVLRGRLASGRGPDPARLGTLINQLIIRSLGHQPGQ
ncbi:MAG: hypothetical protein ACLFWB_03390 [Armatimonadota bacterium]